MDGMTEAYQVTVVRKDTGEVVYDGTVAAEVSSLELTLKGKGTVIYEIKIGGIWLNDLEVVFN